jgi:hypothetical protein
MIPYRFKRRSFLAGLGGAFGLESMLTNLEASAAGATSPPRLLVLHWPMGTLRTEFVPTGTGTSYVASPLLQPFEDAGLRNDTIALFGLTHAGIDSGQGGGCESGTVMTMTGANCAGTRDNEGEDDDACAGGPSWDQILLKHVPALAKRSSSGGIVGPGFANAICDSRVEAYETSTRCLSYGYETRLVNAARPMGGMLTEHVPNLPELSPSLLYARLFAGFMPGGSQEATLRALRMRKSVLDSALRELERMNGLAPASERVKIDAHADAIRKLERDLQERIDGGGGTACEVPPAPSATLIGKSGDRNSHLSNPIAVEGDDATHEAVGRAHVGVIRAAFQCDLIRVATFQWAPGTGCVALTGINPEQPLVAYHYRGLSYRVGQPSFWSDVRPTTSPSVDYAYVWDSMKNVYLWYNRRVAELVATFKTATDVFGNSLLSRTIMPYVTEIANPANTRTPLPALIFGGSALGMQGGQFQSLSSRIYNDYWLSIGQAYLGPAVLEALASEVFVKTNVAPIPGLWVAP